ncbi:hypothetical protein [Roseibium algae]|uniref:Uncharacterized protein n=1 Tax=Roseibium algae TaxID=3123038 RepID=A0ABU8TJZ8_9HYPH
MPKSIPISVRLSNEDVAFLAEFEMQGARTPSDKLRGILKNAREQAEGSQDVARCEAMLRDLLRPAERKVRQSQRDNNIRSDFVIKLYQRLPEIVADLTASAHVDVLDRDQLERMEADLAAELFSLIEEVFDLGLTSQSRTYDPQLMQEKLKPVLEIAQLLQLKSADAAQKVIADDQ